MTIKFTLGLIAVTTAALPTLAVAQSLDTIGNRGAALAAFVAVADDATAAVWNPAALINGPIFNIALDFGRLTREPGTTVARALQGATATTGGLIAVGVPPLGISYYRGRITEVVPSGSADGLVLDRQDRQVGVRVLELTQVGVTVLQSLADGLTVGTTLKLMRGSVGNGVIEDGSWAGAFDRAETLDGAGSTKFAVDAGVLYGPRGIRVGLLARNLTKPRFGAQSAGITLDRHVRAGVAWGDGWPGIANTIVAFDVDLTRVISAAGERRDVAAGIERWLWNQRFGVRGGVRVSSTGEARPIGSGGVSFAPRSGMYVDAYVARGRAHDRGWGVAARVAY